MEYLLVTFSNSGYKGEISLNIVCGRVNGVRYKLERLTFDTREPAPAYRTPGVFQAGLLLPLISIDLQKHERKSVIPTIHIVTMNETYEKWSYFNHNYSKLTLVDDYITVC